MVKSAKHPTRKNGRHLRVPVLPDEEGAIKAKAASAGLSVAEYLRCVGMGYHVSGIVDYKYVRELARINGDLGRLGGLLKLWLTNDERTKQFGESTIKGVLSRIESTQNEMSKVMLHVVMPRSER